MYMRVAHVLFTPVDCMLNYQQCSIKYVPHYSAVALIDSVGSRPARHGDGLTLADCQIWAASSCATFGRDNTVVVQVPFDCPNQKVQTTLPSL